MCPATFFAPLSRVERVPGWDGASGLGTAAARNSPDSCGAVADAGWLPTRAASNHLPALYGMACSSSGTGSPA
jgi:hypothetical protein